MTHRQCNCSLLEWGGKIGSSTEHVLIYHEEQHFTLKKKKTEEKEAPPLVPLVENNVLCRVKTGTVGGGGLELSLSKEGIYHRK